MGLFEHFPYTNFHSLNIQWAIEKIKELLQQGETLYGQLQQWKTETNAELAAWKTQTLADLDAWKTSTGNALSALVDGKIDEFDTWWEQSRAGLEALVEQAGQDAQTATGALSDMQAIFSELLNYSTFVSLNDGTPLQDATGKTTITGAYSVLERSNNTIRMTGHVAPAASSGYLWNVAATGSAGPISSLSGSPYISLLADHYYRISFRQTGGSWTASAEGQNPYLGVFSINPEESPTTRLSYGGLHLDTSRDIHVTAPRIGLCIGPYIRFPATGSALTGWDITYDNFTASIIIEDVTEEYTDDTINILTIGSSFLQDSVAYAGKIMQEAGVKVRIYDIYRSGTSASEYLGHESDISWENEPVYLNRWEPESSAWVRETGKALSDILPMHKWRLIYAQQTITQADGFMPVYNMLCNYCHDFIYVSGGQLPRDSETILSQITALSRNAEEHTTVAYWSYGSYAWHACATTPLMQAISGIQNEGMPWGIYETTGTSMHQIAGLPAIINAYAFCDMVYRAAHMPYSVAGSAWVPTTANCTAINAGPMTHGNSVGATAANCKLAQEAVMMASKYPRYVPLWSDTWSTYIKPIIP